MLSIRRGTAEADWSQQYSVLRYCVEADNMIEAGYHPGMFPKPSETHNDGV